MLSPAPAAAAGASAMPVGARPNATRLDFRAGDAVQANVDVGTGNLMVMTTDLTLPGIEKDLQLGLVYNSLLVGSGSPAADSPAGIGWQLRIGEDTELVENADGSVLYLAPGGLQGLYQPTSGNNYATPAGFKNTLTKTASGWELTDHATNAVSLFNTAGRLTAIEDRNGQATTFGYSGGHVTTVASTRGGSGARSATYGYDIGYGGYATLAQVSQTGDGGATRTVTYTVDDSNPTGPLLTSFTDTLGRTTSFGYNVSNRLTSITNTAGITTQFTYDGSGRVTKVTRVDPAGPDAVTRVVYSSGTVTRVADPTTDPAVAVISGPHTTYTLNADDRVTQAVDPLGRTRSATYTPMHDVASATSGTGGQTSFGYTANSGESLTDVTSPTGVSTSWAYGNTGPAQFLPSGSTDAQGNQTSYTYDGAGNQTATENTALAASAEVTYHPDGVLATSKDPRGNTTTYTRHRRRPHQQHRPHRPGVRWRTGH